MGESYRKAQKRKNTARKKAARTYSGKKAITLRSSIKKRSSQFAMSVQKARDAARARDNYTCQISGVTDALSMIDGAHLFPVRTPYPRYDATDPRFVVSLRRDLHQFMDRIKNHRARAEWLRDCGLSVYADRILWIIGDLEGECP